MAKLVITASTKAGALSFRAKKQRRTGPSMTLSPMERAVHFLRGIHSRATYSLPAFYLFLGASADGACSLDGYPGLVLKETLAFSSLGTVALSCRKIFDHAGAGLTGGEFARAKPATIEAVAEYWQQKSGRTRDEALAALALLQSIFHECTRSDDDLFRAGTSLGSRVGLLKQYANPNFSPLTEP